MRLKLSTLLLFCLFGSGAALPALAEDAAAPKKTVPEIGRALDDLDQRLRSVESVYVARAQTSPEAQLLKQFSSAQMHFLLENHAAASALLYDLLGKPAFKPLREYGEALYMLAESLYQQKSFLSARLYFREYLNQGGREYRHALLRYLDISVRLNEFSGIERYVEQIRTAEGTLPGDVAYAYGKWFFRRKDLPEAERQRRAQALFEDVVRKQSSLATQAQYFLGVLAVQRGALDEAIAAFSRVLELPAEDERGRQVHDEAQLALGRILFEQGRYFEAAERYQAIDYRAEAFIDALYETAWVHVRHAQIGKHPSEFEKANQACEKLLLAAPDSLLAPDALVLQGHLQLKLGQFDAAIAAYRGVLDRFRPAHDELSQKLSAHRDPVAYFQKTIHGSDKTFDLRAFLPESAIPWASTQNEIAIAVGLTEDIDESQVAIAEASEIAARLLDLLDSRKFELFPVYQKGLSQAEEVRLQVTGLERALLAIEDAHLPERAATDALRLVQTERRDLELQMAALPKNEADYAAWRKKLQSQTRKLEHDAYRIGFYVDSLFAIQEAIAQLLNESPGLSLSDRAEFEDRLRQERAVAKSLRTTLDGMRRQIRDEKMRIETLRPDGMRLYADYEALLAQERTLLAQLRPQGSLDARTSADIDAAYAAIGQIKRRADAAQAHIRQTIEQQAEDVRSQIVAESNILEGLKRENTTNVARARNLIGSIAYESFKQVLHHFHMAMLKADVGLVDVAWTRKQNLTGKIHDLARQKEIDLNDLDLEFKEALVEVN